MKSLSKLLIALLTLTPGPALAVNYPRDLDQFVHVTEMALSEREMLLAAAFMLITAVGLTAFAFAKHFSARTLLALIMICVFISAIALVFLFSTSHGADPLFGLIAIIGLLALFKLMNQFEIKR